MLDHVLRHLGLLEMLGFALILLGGMDVKTGFAPEAPTNVVSPVNRDCQYEARK